MSNAEHEQARKETGFWGRKAAGCIFYCPATKNYGIARRSLEVLEPRTWGTVGGAIDPKEDPEKAVRREVAEELKYTGQFTLRHLWTFKHDSGFEYHNFLATVDEEFEPVLDWENDGFKWLSFSDLLSLQLHPGMKALLTHWRGEA